MAVGLVTRSGFFKIPAVAEYVAPARAPDRDALGRRDGVLEVSTRIDNLSILHRPVAIGLHPSFSLTRFAAR